ncbi:MAG TPA: hypothetical protein PK402_05255 [Tepidisphaeraceae bacterium]|nr:hypothetical protein [Tepidisphaeraceae bacterium]
MSIRLVNDAGDVYWFTGGNWRRVLAFASRHGWQSNPLLEPDNWDESLTWNDKYEIVGGASLAKAESHALADAIDRGVREDPAGASVVEELEVHAEAVRQELPDYDPALYAADLLKEWLRFRDFARGSALRVDLTD